MNMLNNSSGNTGLELADQVQVDKFESGDVGDYIVDHFEICALANEW